MIFGFIISEGVVFMLVSRKKYERDIKQLEKQLKREYERGYKNGYEEGELSGLISEKEGVVFRSSGIVVFKNGELKPAD